MASLHQVLIADSRAWRDCAALYRGGDSVLLADAGVELLMENDFVRRFSASTACGELLALKADVLARGLRVAARSQGVKLLSDREWVQQACAHEKVLSWK